MSLLIALHQKKEDAFAPEFRYLHALNLDQGHRVFGTVHIHPNPSSCSTGYLDASDYVLVMGPEHVLLNGASLQRMKQRLDHGADVVLPSPLSAFPFSERRPPVHTLRAYEQVEQCILQKGHGPSEPPTSHLPVSLFTAVSFRNLVVRAPLADVWGHPHLLDGAREGSVAREGVYYAFMDYYGAVRDDLLPLLPSQMQDVLEVGCGRGHTGTWMQEQFGCRVTGIEMNPVVAHEAAEHLCHVIVGDVLEVPIPGTYDVVVATELYEHLTYPDQFLAKMKSVLKPGGRIVLSVPNVGHHAIVEDLLAGRWDYVPMGLLCYTHFRFYTRHTLENDLRRAGFSSFDIIPQKTELPRRFRRGLSAFEADLDSLATSGFWIVIHG